MSELKSFQTVYHLKEGKLIQIATKEFPNSLLSNEGNGDFALITTTEPYQLSSQWTGQFSKNDLKVINIKNGDSKIAIESNPSTARFSPKGEYAYGYNQVDSTWYTYNIKTSKYNELTKGKLFYNEDNDYPNFPRSYGSAGWTKKDKNILSLCNFNGDDTDAGSVYTYNFYKQFGFNGFNYNTTIRENTGDGEIKYLRSCKSAKYSIYYESI